MRATVSLLLLAFACSTQAQAPRPSENVRPGFAMERYVGSNVPIELAAGVVVNKTSTLKREWFVVRDASAPAAIEGPAGVYVSYRSDDRSSIGQYQYRMPYEIRAKEPISAIEVRVIVLDVFGRLLKTLSATEVGDFTDTRSFDATWRVWPENDAAAAFASIAYVAHVRTASGRVYEADQDAVFDQVRKVANRITQADLEPKREQTAR